MLLLNLPDSLLAVVKDIGHWFHVNTNFKEKFFIANTNFYFWNAIFKKFLNEKMKFYLQDFFNNDRSINLDKIGKFQKRIDVLNSRQEECFFSLFDGIKLRSCAYTITELLDFVESWNKGYKEIFDEIAAIILSANVKAVFFNITSMFQMAFALGLILAIKKQAVAIKLILANYSYENFIVDTNKVHHIFDEICDFYNYKRIFNGMQSTCNKPDQKHLNQFALSKYNVLSIKIFDMDCYWKKCTFCSQNEKKCSNTGYNVSTAIDKIHYYLSNFMIDTFVFTDESIPKDILLDLSKRIIAFSLVISWNCRLRFDNVFSEEELMIIKTAGCKGFLFGIETNSNNVLRQINKYDKDFDENAFLEICKTIKKSGIELQYSFIVGFPFERKEDLSGLKTFMLNLINNGLHFSYFINCFVLFPKAKIAEKMKNYLLSPNKTENDFNLPILTRYNNIHIMPWIKYMDKLLQKKLIRFRFRNSKKAYIVKFLFKSAYALHFNYGIQSGIFKYKFRKSI